MLKSHLLLILTTTSVGCLSLEAPSVVTKSGKIVGRYLTSFGGNKYEAYQGIPFALPPIGDRRFEPPVAIPPWSGDLLADHLRSPCWEDNREPNSAFEAGDEDCLYLNVFVPDLKHNSTLHPVLFWIHGGGFQYGSAHRPEQESYLMDRPVILVTMQYRLGSLGFLSTEDRVVPGNMGLKDQSLALAWVHDNVRHFGGDPRRISLFGHSAGAASVHYHYLSPMSRGLFRNGVSYSGTAFVSWAQAKNSRRKAMRLGRILGCKSYDDDAETVVRCLRSRPAREIVRAQREFAEWRLTPRSNFGPVVEVRSSSGEAFVDRSPREIIDSGEAYDAPWITGVTSEEGLFPTIEWANSAVLREIDADWDGIAPFLLDYNHSVPRENWTRIARAVRKHYFGDEPIDGDSFMRLAYLVGDRWFVVDAENAARAQARSSPVLFYYYGHRAVDSMSFELSNNTEYRGVSHGDDVYLFLKNPYLVPTKSKRDMAMQKVLMDILISFATEGYPDIDVDWPEVQAANGNLSYLYIAGPGEDEIEAKFSDNLGEKQFWNSIDFDENRPKNSIL